MMKIGVILAECTYYVSTIILFHTSWHSKTFSLQYSYNRLGS